MVDKAAAHLLPVDRAFTEAEALLSLEIDRNNGKEWSYRGYEKLWGWSFSRVHRFIRALGSPGGLSQVGKKKIKAPVHLIEQNRRISSGSAAGHTNPAMTGVDNGQRIRNGSDTDHTIEKKTEREDVTSGKTDRIPYSEIVAHLNQATGRNYRHTTKKTRSLITGRFNEGFTLQDFKAVVDDRVRRWQHDLKMAEYLRPETLFGTKFEGYLQAIGGIVKDCTICDHYNGGKCENLSLPGYPEACQSFNPTENN